MDILFSYAYESTMYVLGKPEMYKSMTVYTDAIVQYIANDKDEEIIEVDDMFIKEIENILKKHSEIIDAIPEELYNDSYDGGYSHIRFQNKQVKALNLSKCNIEEIKIINNNYYKKFRSNIEHENVVVAILDEIKILFEKYKIPCIVLHIR